MSAFTASAQTPTVDTPVVHNDVNFFSETLPEFPGGEKGLMKFLKNHIYYPESARTAGIEGKVIARFIVNKKGKVTDIEIEKSLTTECDNEVIRVIKLMPRWKPGLQSGEKVAVYFTLPINFKL